MTKFNLLEVAGAVISALGLVASGVSVAHAGDSSEVATAGAGGYDPVAYFTESKAVKGSGRYTAEHQGVTYLFSNESNRDAFKKDPAQYLPAYGGYCAYGVAIGKKFWADPAVWEIVDGTLYLNLDKSIQQEWDKDKTGYITKAESNWSSIKDKSAGDL
ncbi:MAG TPA: YHS domain-containing (seleno)protein [Thermodesulfobacteriota bacterium]|nr:YHS domain-containing (seleno)protein [Thermodesulfobacteriota bacterium]